MTSALGCFMSVVFAAGSAPGLEVPPADEIAPPAQVAPQYLAKLSIAQSEPGKPAQRLSAPSFCYIDGGDAKMRTWCPAYELECEVGVRNVGGVKMHALHGSIKHFATPTSPQRTTKFNLLVPNGRRDAVLTDDGLLVELEADVHRPLR